MKTKICLILILALDISCANRTPPADSQTGLQGTWQLVSATLVEKGDTTTTSYGTDQKMIKIINETHFAFLNHDIKNGRDSTRKFSAGGGRYTLKGEKYTEFLDYCSDREWEGHQFEFTVKVEGDTLIQTGIEEVEDMGVERRNTEKYARLLRCADEGLTRTTNTPPAGGPVVSGEKCYF